jgi:hypothetical protein
MSTRKPGSLVVAPSSKPGNGTLWRDIHSVDGAYSPAYVGEAIESDAILFAAAPDLIAALENLIETAPSDIEAEDSVEKYRSFVLRVACAAVAAVQGGAK